MSTILKALKKLEEEQAGRPAGQPPYGGQYLAPRRRAGWRTAGLIGGGVLAGLLLAYGGWLLSAPRPAPPVVAERETPAAARQAPVAQAPASPTALPVAAPPAPGPPAATRAAPSSSPAPPATGKPVAAPVPLPVSKPPAVVTPPPAAPTVVEQVQVERREIPAPGQQWSASHLMVSDILPAAGGGRMAIVNGLPVMEGTMVENALVKEIRADGVLFLIDGKSVAVPLGSPP